MSSDWSVVDAEDVYLIKVKMLYMEVAGLGVWCVITFELGMPGEAATCVDAVDEMKVVESCASDACVVLVDRVCVFSAAECVEAIKAGHMVTVDGDEGDELLSDKSTGIPVEVTTWTAAGTDAAAVTWVDKVFVIVFVVKGTPNPWFSVNTVAVDFVAVGKLLLKSDSRVEEDGEDAESVDGSVWLADDADVNVE